MEIFLGLKPSLRIVQPSPMRIYKNIKGIDEERSWQKTSIDKAHDALQRMYKKVCNSKSRRRSRAQLINNARTNILPISIKIGHHIMIRTNAICNRKL